MVYQSSVDSGSEGFSGNHPGKGMVQARYLQGFSYAIDSLGGNAQNIFEVHGLNPSAFDDPDIDVDCVPPLQMMEYCSLHLGDPLFGLKLADQQGPDAFGCLAVAAKAAPTFRAALRIFVDYQHIINSPEGVVELVECKDVGELRWRTGLDMSRQSHYHGLLLFRKTLDFIWKGTFQPLYASLRFRPESRVLDELQRKIDCRIVGGSAANAIAFPKEILDRPVSTSNRMLYTVLIDQFERLRRTTTTPTFSEQVEAYIRDALPTGHCNVRYCSEELGTSIRTLQKRLGDSNLKFSDLVEKQRIEIAKQALKSRGAALSDIAFNLGYADQTSFGRAFKRWTGITPKVFRARLLKLG